MKTLLFSLFVFGIVSCGKGNKSGSIELIPQNPDRSKQDVQVDALKGTGPLLSGDVEVEINRAVEFDVKNGIHGASSNYKEYIAALNKRKIKLRITNKDFLNNNLHVTCTNEDKGRILTAVFSNLVAELPLYTMTDKDPLNPVIECSIMEEGEHKTNKSFKLTKDIYITKDILNKKDKKNEKEEKDDLEKLQLVSGQRNEIGALIFEEDVVLTTNGKSLSISATEIISDNGTLQTFKENSVAENEKEGANGGDISIKTDLSYGLLEVKMRGQNGGRNTIEDRRDYTDYRYVQDLYNKQNTNICHLNAQIPVQIDVPDLTGLKGGDSGQFYIKAKDAQMDIRIEGFGGLGGPGGHTYLNSKERKIKGRLVINDHVVTVPHKGWAFELMDKREFDITFAYCGDVVLKCANRVTQEEKDPNYRNAVYDLCKVGLANLATNWHFKKISLLLEATRSGTLNQGETGPHGRRCVQRIEDNVVKCEFGK